MKLYLAGPWFTAAQAEREQRIKNKLKDLGFDVFSPKDDCNITGTFADKTIQKSVFLSNIEHIEAADIIFAICDGKQCESIEEDQKGRYYNAIDSGTLIEAGFAFALKRNGKDIKIVYYAETLGNKEFNLMLAQSADIVITNFDDLNNLKSYLDSIGTQEHLWNGLIE